MFPNNVKPQIAFTGRTFSTSFQIKDKTERGTPMLLHITMNAQRKNIKKTTLVKPEVGSLKGLQTMVEETQNLILMNIL